MYKFLQIMILNYILMAHILRIFLITYFTSFYLSVHTYRDPC